MKNNEQKEILTYTIIIHQAKKTLKISLNEYCITDSIYHLQNNPKSNLQGWCYASKKTLGNYIDVSEQSAHSIISGLIKKELIEKDPDTRYLRTTQLWYDNVILLKLNSRNLSHTKESLVSHPRKLSATLKEVESDTKESLDNIDKDIDINKNIDNKDDNLSIKELLEKYPDFDTFYSLYPRKVGPRKALKSFKKISKKLLPDILEDIETKKETKAWLGDKDFIPHPATYLNQKRWEDIDKGSLPEKKKPKPFYRGDPMVYSEARKKWYVIDNGEWKDFAGREEDIDWETK